jgi:hypothetical protein
MNKFLWSVLLLPILFFSCSGNEKKEKEFVLAEVNNQKILLADAVKSMPKGLEPKDSINFIKEYLSNKIKDILVYEQAKTKISSSNVIDSMVESYRRSLIVYEFQQQILAKGIESDFTDEEIQKFYKDNISKFSSDRNLVKGIFMKVDKDATNIDKLKKWYRKPNSESLDKIESFSVQNAVIYNYFMDEWTGLEEVTGNMPKVKDNPSAYLKKGSTIEIVDEGYCYLLYIKDFILIGKPAPIEYIRPQVLNVLKNSRKTDFLRKYEQELLESAEKNEKVIYY